MKTLISLIGEQPIPNLLPILYLKPDNNMILFTDTTESTAKRIERLIPACSKHKTVPYDIQEIKNTIYNLLNESDQFIFNITGGTKVMSAALFQIAIERKADSVYLQSEGNYNSLFNYKVKTDGSIKAEKIILPELIDIDLYLKAHLPDYVADKSLESGSGFEFEKTILALLRSNNFEVIPNIKPKGEGNKLEIDAVIRVKGTNNVGIAEIKIGDKAEEGPKKGIDQLALASQREYLGIYTKRFLITERELKKDIKELAWKHQIIIIDNIERQRNNNELTPDSKIRLLQRIKEKLS